MASVTRVRALVATAALAALPLVLGAAATPAHAATPAPGGFAEAYGLLVDATVLEGNIPVVVGPFAPVASSCPPGGSDVDQVVDVPASPVADAGVLTTGAGTDCGKKSALAKAQTSTADILEAVAALTIHTDEITSTAGVTCATAPVGSTVIANLTVGGTAVPLPAVIPPNFDLLPEVFGPFGIRVILNEQHPAASGRGIVVNGIHVIAADTGVVPVGGAVLRGDVIVSHAQAGVFCPGGPGSDNGGLPAPDIRFAKTGAPSSVQAGDTVTYTATVTNTSTAPCEVLKLIDHVAPAFALVSSDGPFGTELEDPAPVRGDGGVDAVLRPTDLVIAPGASLVQTFTVTAKDDAAPGTYYDSLEIYCAAGGNFVSGPLAPVTITAPAPAKPVAPARPAKPVVHDLLPRTGGTPMTAASVLVLALAAFGLARRRTQH